MFSWEGRICLPFVTWRCLHWILLCVLMTFSTRLSVCRYACYLKTISSGALFHRFVNDDHLVLCVGMLPPNNDYMARLNSCPSEEEIESSWSLSLFRSDDMMKLLFCLCLLNEFTWFSAALREAIAKLMQYISQWAPQNTV